MRVIKTSLKEFKHFEALQEFFLETLPIRKPSGLFRITKGRISGKGLYEGEILLFSYEGRVRFTAVSKTKRQDNTYDPDPAYPFCFIVDPDSIRQCDISFSDLQERFKTVAGINKRLTGQGWTIIPDSPHTQEVVNSIIL